MAERILVTGASGFIGLALCRLLRQRFPDYEIVGLTRTAEATRLLTELGVTPILGDLTRIDSYQEAIPGCRWVFHLGANASFHAKNDYSAVNVEGTRTLVDALVRSGGIERFVFVSSIGAVDRGPGDDCRLPLSVDSPPHPSSEYGRSKLQGEQIVRSSGLPFTVVRPSWVYGPGMRRDSHLAVLLDAAAQGKMATLVGFPGCVSVVHVEDLARALVEVPTIVGTQGKTYFADDGTPRSFAEVFRLGHEFAGRKSRLLPIPAPLIAAMRRLRRLLPFTLRCLFVDVLTCRGEIFADTGVVPMVGFEDGLREVWEEMANPKGAVHLITGAASGIGEAIAREMARRGQRLLLIDRSSRLDQIGRDLSQATLQLDLASDDVINRIATHLRENRLFIAGLVNCAGFGVRAEICGHTLQQIEDLAQVNFTVPVKLCRLVLPGMLKRRSGYILNIASSVAEVPLPGMAMYAATKAALFSFSRSLWGELRGTGVRVVALLPSGTRTNFQATAGVKVLRESRGLVTPEHVAAVALHALEHNRPVVLIGWQSRLLLGLTRHLPHAGAILLWKKLFTSMR